MIDIRDVCTPRPDVLSGGLEEKHFAAQLDQVVIGAAGYEAYADAERFFALTYPTHGLKELLSSTFARLTAGGGASRHPGAQHAVYRYETTFGGGKTHGLIALWHLAAGARPSNVSEFVEPDLLPQTPCAQAVIVGDRLDPLNGLTDPATGITTSTFWGEIARQLGPEVWARFERSDRMRTAPGKQLWLDAFAQRPTLIVIDELAVHLSQLASSADNDVRRQEEATLQALKVLFEAATAAPTVRLIFTLATGTAAFGTHTNRLRQAISSVSVERVSEDAHDVMARSKGAVGRPADDHEIGHILRRRLFEHVDDGASEAMFGAYKEAYSKLSERDPQVLLGAAESDPASYCERIRSSYPFHPALIDCLDKRIGPLPGFQRARGALKLLAESLAVLWNVPAAQRSLLPIVNLGDLPLHAPAVRSCITGGINRAEMDPPAQADFAGDASHAAAVDSQRWPQQRLAQRCCTTVFCHSVATDSVGATETDVHLGTLRPDEEPALVDEALGAVVAAAWHLHSDAGRWRFRVEPNANKIVATEMANVSQSEITEELEAKIRRLFATSGSLRAVHFPAAPGDVDDAARLQVAVMNHSDAVAKQSTAAPPSLVRRIADRCGTDESHRTFRNGLVFVVADAHGVGAARDRVQFELAAKRVLAPHRVKDFSSEVHKKLRALADEAELGTRTALARAYQHIWWPERAKREGGGVQLRSMDLPPSQQGKTSGSQTERVLKLLRDYAKVTDKPLATDALARSSGFDRQGEITTEALAQAPWRDPSSAVVLDQALIVKTIEAGINNATWVCRDESAGKTFTRDQPRGQVRIAADVLMYSVERAKKLGVMPTPESGSGEETDEPPEDDNDDGPGGGGDSPGVPLVSLVIEGRGSAGVALNKLTDQIGDRGVTSLARISVRVDIEPGQGVQPFRLLGHCVAQLARFDAALKLDTVAEFGGLSGAATYTLEGPARGCTPVFDALYGALDQASGLAGSLTLKLTLQGTISCAGQDFRQLQEVLKRAQLGHVVIEAEAADGH